MHAFHPFSGNRDDYLRQRYERGMGFLQANNIDDAMEAVLGRAACGPQLYRSPFRHGRVSRAQGTH